LKFCFYDILAQLHQNLKFLLPTPQYYNGDATSIGSRVVMPSSRDVTKTRFQKGRHFLQHPLFMKSKEVSVHTFEHKGSISMVFRLDISPRNWAYKTLGRKKKEIKTRNRTCSFIDIDVMVKIVVGTDISCQ
jgi:hypothetical protein